MKPSAIHPRVDQIGELTRGLSLPLDPIDGDHLQVIAEGLSRAFQEIQQAWPAIVATGSEAEVTALLVARLNSLIDHDIFWGQLVMCVVRGAESSSADASHIEKRPDLSIYLSSHRRNFPLIAEAKILDSTKTEGMYCNNGLSRFLTGEYAWARQEAFMVGYVRDGSSIETRLLPFLKADMATVPSRYAVEVPPTSAGGSIGDLAKSRHGRKFTYSHQTPLKHTPGSIDIWHLWLA